MWLRADGGRGTTRPEAKPAPSPWDGPDAGAALERTGVSPRPHHRLLDGVLGFEPRPEHPVAVAGQLAAERFEVGESHRGFADGHGTGCYRAEIEREVRHQELDGRGDQKSSVFAPSGFT